MAEIQRTLACFGDYVTYPQPQEVDSRLTQLYPHLWSCIHESFDWFTEMRSQNTILADYTEGQVAQFLRPQIMARAERKFEGNFRVAIRTVKQLQFLQIDNELAIIFKKLTRLSNRRGETYLARSNYSTPQNLDLWEQRKCEGFPDIPRVIVGYEMLHEMTNIKVWVGHPRSRHKGLSWQYVMPDQSAAAFEGIRRAEFADQEQPSDLGFRVKKKEVQQDERG